MSDRPLRIATTRQLERSVRAAGHEAFLVPDAAGQNIQRGVPERVADARVYAPFFEQNDIDLVLDFDTAALALAAGPGDPAPVSVLAAEMGIPHVTSFIDPVIATMGQMPWTQRWQLLQQPTWVKWIWEQTHTEELHRLGVPGLLTLPMAAPDGEYDTSPLPTAVDTPVLAFLGHPATGWFSSQQSVRSDQLYPGLLAAAVHADLPDVPFHKIYYDLYELDAPPDAGDDVATQLQKACRYFDAKFVYQAYLALKQRDRWVRFLQRKLGESFELIGDHWDKCHSLRSAPSLYDKPAMYRKLREVPICLNLMKGNQESGVILRHFEITACGGFMLTYPTPELPLYFEVGKECETFRNEQELLEKIGYYLAHDEERREIAAAGQRRTLREHLYSHRIGQLISQLRAGGVLTPRPKRTAAEVLQWSGSAAPADAAAAPAATSPAPAPVPGPVAPAQDADPAVLVLQNPGRVSRYYLTGMVRALREAQQRTVVYELADIWNRSPEERPPATAELVEMLRRENVRAVVGYCMNGAVDWACTPGSGGELQNVFDQLGIEHLLWWTDHPQWASDKAALRDEFQPLLRGGSKTHLLKGEAHARELVELLGWQRCHALAVAEDPQLVKPAAGVAEAFDVVAITGAPPRLPAELEPLLQEDEPDQNAIHTIVAEQARERLHALWNGQAPAGLQAELTALGDAWIAARRDRPRRQTYYHYRDVAARFPAAKAYIAANPRLYFDAAEVVWSFYEWQRTFMLRYLARFFKVGVFGPDWLNVGIDGGSWVSYERQAAAYARGRLALNISQRGEEDGASHKPFQIAASGVAQVHIDRPGLAALFEPGVEIALFDTPAQARQVIAELLADDARRRDLAEAGRARFLRDHTWRQRVPQMFELAGVHLPALHGGPSTGGAATAGPVATKAMPASTGRSELVGVASLGCEQDDCL